MRTYIAAVFIPRSPPSPVVGFFLPEDTDGDALILAGDIITFGDYSPFARLLAGWKKPAIFVTGNHEYYTQTPMVEEEEAFAAWLKSNQPQVHFLRDQSISINGVHFFGGTMWTNFNGGNTEAMRTAQMNEPALLIKRFDRAPEGRIHFEEFNQLLGRSSRTKYDGAHKDMADFILKACACFSAILSLNAPFSLKPIETPSKPTFRFLYYFSMDW